MGGPRVRVGRIGTSLGDHDGKHGVLKSMLSLCSKHARFIETLVTRLLYGVSPLI